MFSAGNYLGSHPCAGIVPGDDSSERSSVDLIARRAQYLEMKTDEEERLIAHAVTRLSVEYPSVPADDVARIVASAHVHFDGHRVRDFVPLLVERMAGERLSSLVVS